MTHVYGWSSGRGGTHWYRIAEPLRGLRILGTDTSIGPDLTDERLDQCDTILVHLLHDERNSEAWQKIAKRGTHKLVYDIDDDIWNFDPRTETYNYWTRERLLTAQENIAAADVVTTPSAYLAELLYGLNKNVWVLPNTVPEWLLHYQPTRWRQKFVMGYQGARQHVADLQMIGHDLALMLRRHRNARMHIWGELNPLGLPVSRVIRTPWCHDIPTYYRSLSMSVGLGPLRNTPFNHAKSGIRAVEYAALGIPAILTDVPAYRPYIQSGWNGYLVSHEDDWYETLEACYQDRTAMEIMGGIARRTAQEWTTEKNAHKWLEAYA